METTIRCPNCKSNDIYFRIESCYCAACGNRFQSGNEVINSDEILLATKTNDPLSVFISYAHKQSPIVNRIVEGIKKRGHHVWFDQDKIGHGDDWRKSITDGLIQSNGVLSFLSKEAIRKNGVCLDELGIAVGVKYGNIRTVLLHKEEELQPIPMQLTHRQWLDLSDWEEKSKGDSEKYDKWINSKIAIILRMIESDESREFAGDISHIRNRLDISDTAISRQSWYLKQLFVGREWLAGMIKEWLDSDTSEQTCVVYGGPGSGKSAFAAQYVYHSSRVIASLFFEHGNNYFNSPETVLRELVFQLSCRIPSYRRLLISILNDDRNIEKFNTKELFERLIATPLQKAVDGGHEKLAIIIDGLDECENDQQKSIIQLINSIRFPSWLKVIVFSRPEPIITESLNADKEIRIDNEIEKNEEDIRSFIISKIRNNLNDLTNQEVDEIVSKTNGVFLYAYLLTNLISADENHYKRYSQFPNGLNAVFDAWFSRYFPDMEEYNQLFRLPLGLIAISNGIPIDELEMIDGWFDSKQQAFFVKQYSSGSLKRDIKKRLERCDLLLKYGKNEYGKETVSFSHRYVKDWLLEECQSEDRKLTNRYSCFRKEALWALKTVWVNRLAGADHLTEYQALNLLKVLSESGESIEAIKSFSCSPVWKKTLAMYGNYYYQKNDIRQSLSFAKADYERICLIYNEYDSEVLEARDKIIHLYLEMGYLGDALEYANTNYLTKKRVLGLDAPETLTSLEQTAQINFKLGYVQEALIAEKKVYLRRKRVLGSDHQDTLCSGHYLAEICLECEQYSEAKKYAEEVLYKRQALLGENDPDTIETLMLYLSIQHTVDPQFEIISKYLRVYKYACKHYGNKHPESLQILKEIAKKQYEEEEYEKALRISSYLYETLKGDKGETNPNTLSAYVRMAKCKLNTQTYDDALNDFLRIYNIKRSIFGNEHPNVIDALEDVAYTYICASSFDKGITLLKNVYDIRIRNMGILHKKTQITSDRLVHAYIYIGEFQMAKDIAWEKYKAIAASQGNKSEDSLIAKSDVSYVYEKEGDHNTAYNLNLELLNDAMDGLPASSDLVQDAKISVAHNLYHLDRDREAYDICDSAFSFLLLKHGEKNLFTIRAMEGLALVCDSLGEQVKAINLEKKVYGLRKSLFGIRHDKTHQTLKNLVDMLYENNMLEESYSYCKILHETSTRRHQAIEALSIIGKILNAMNKCKEALSIWEEVFEQNSSIWGPDHENTIWALEQLIKICVNLNLPEETIKYRKMLLEAKRRIKGETAEETIIEMKFLADSYSDHKKYQEHIKLRKEILDVYMKTRGIDDLNTLEAMLYVAIAYSWNGQHNEAWEVEQTVYEKYKVLLGQEHEETLKTLGWLKKTSEDLNLPEETIRYRKILLETQKRTKGETAEETIVAMKFLADSYNNYKMYQEHLKIRKEILDVYIKTRGIDDLNTLNAMIYVAAAYSWNGQHNEAWEVEQTVYEKRKELLGPEHEETLKTLDWLIKTSEDLNLPEETLKYRKILLETQKKTKGLDCHETLQAMIYLAKAYIGLGLYNEALEIEKEALKERIKINGKKHPETITAMEWISHTYSLMNMQEEKEEMDKQLSELKNN